MARRKPPRVPPPESEVWPEEFRGEKWKPAFAFLFEGKCQVCAYSSRPSKSRQRLDKFFGLPRLLQCTNHPSHGGESIEVLPTDTCRNFKCKVWHWLEKKRLQASVRFPESRPGHRVEQIPLGNGLFATIDAADYPEISKYKWHAARHGRKVYALCKSNGKTTSMHKMLARPRKGYIVDHKDGNGLNNCRDNLRVCMRGQNQANRGSTGGTSRFVGVYRCGNKWVAYIQARGKWYYVGRFDDEVEAAKARDRKAWELNGEFAYLNFPEDFAGKRWRKPAAKRAVRATGRRRPR